MITQITEKIYIGDQKDAESEAVLKEFQAVVNVNDRSSAEEESLIKKYNVQTYRCLKGVPPRSWVVAADVLRGYVKRGLKVLVHCEAGIDRAPFVVVCYLHYANKLKWCDAYSIVKGKRKCVMEHWEWIHQVDLE